MLRVGMSCAALGHNDGCSNSDHREVFDASESATKPGVAGNMSVTQSGVDGD